MSLSKDDLIRYGMAHVRMALDAEPHRAYPTFRDLEVVTRALLGYFADPEAFAAPPEPAPVPAPPVDLPPEPLPVEPAPMPAVTSMSEPVALAVEHAPDVTGV